MLSSWDKCVSELARTPRSTLPQYNARDSFLVQVLWEDCMPTALIRTWYSEIGVRTNAFRTCCANTPKWCNTNHIGIEPFSLTYAFVKSTAYAKMRVKTDTFSQRTGSSMLMFVPIIIKAISQYTKNSIFCRFLRTVYKSYFLSSRPALDCILVVLEGESTLICFDGSEDCVSILRRDNLFPPSMKGVFLRREGFEVLGIHMMMILYYKLSFVFQGWLILWAHFTFLFNQEGSR